MKSILTIPKGIGVDRTLWCRYEMKYVISQSKAAAIERFIQPYLKLDRYCKCRPDAAYPIVSLYLDSDNMQLCRESLRGHLKRFKLRVRSYSDEHDCPRFFEVKRRANTIIIKSRARVMHQDVADLLSGRYIPPVRNYKTEADALKQFQLYMKSIVAKPKVLIRYIRRAYESDTENRLRITFDRQLAYRASSDSQVLFNGKGWRDNSVTLRDVILEIKFTGRYPAWLGRMVRYFDLRHQSMSKYATSVQRACSLRFCAPEVPIVEY